MQFTSKQELPKLDKKLSREIKRELWKRPDEIPTEILLQLKNLAQTIQGDADIAKPSVMLLGFNSRDTIQLFRLFTKMNWQVLPEACAAAVPKYIPDTTLDSIVIDLDKIDVYPPLLVQGLRNLLSSGQACKIVGISRHMLPEFRHQLKRAGTDFILETRKS